LRLRIMGPLKLNCSNVYERIMGARTLNKSIVFRCIMGPHNTERQYPLILGELCTYSTKIGKSTHNTQQAISLILGSLGRSFHLIRLEHP